MKKMRNRWRKVHSSLALNENFAVNDAILSISRLQLMSLVLPWFVLGVSSKALSGGMDLRVDGWYGLKGMQLIGEPDARLGDDPVVGRLACPALVRLNVSIGKMEPVLLRSLPEVSENDGVRHWRYHMRPNLRWWSGIPVESATLSSWLDHELKDYAKHHAIDKMPKFKISEVGGGIVDVEWSSPPTMGAYFLAGKSFWREKANSSMGYECAGLYRIASATAPDKAELQLAPGYTSKWTKLIMQSESVKDSRSPSIRFVSSGNSPWNAAKSPGQACKQKLDIPLISAIIWNPNSLSLRSSTVRQALTHATPRGEMLRTAAGDLGSLISGPILRSHPGYDPNMLVRPFNLEIAAQKLTEAGFKQENIGSPRLGQQGQQLKLRIARFGKGQELAEKMISDAYASLGINVIFDSFEVTKWSEFDGVFLGVELPWPSLDLRPTFMAKTLNPPGGFPFYSWDDKPLDELLDGYHRSLGAGAPRFDLLQKIHVRWMELEPWTILLAHQLCIEHSGIDFKSGATIADPDWFRRIIME